MDNPSIADEIEHLLADGESGVDERVEMLIDLIEPSIAAGTLDGLVTRFAATNDPALARALAFAVAQAAHRASGQARNRVYTLVPAAIATRDASTHTNLLTAVKRMARSGPPWHPVNGPAPETLTLLLHSALRNGSRNVDDALEALADMGELLVHIPEPDRVRLAGAIDSCDQESAATVASRLRLLEPSAPR